MALATDFTRDDCQMGKKRRSYAALQREWCCNVCSGGLRLQWSDDDEKHPDHWFIECGHCGGTDFIHQRELARQVDAAANVIPALAAYLPTGFVEEAREPVLNRILSTDSEPVEL